MTAPEFTVEQPRDGDLMLTCGHHETDATDRPWYFFKPPTGQIVFMRPNGTSGTARWITCCDACFIRAKGDFRAVQIRGDATWLGDEPAITRELQA